MRGADILVQMLIGYGVETIFGVPGDLEQLGHLLAQGKSCRSGNVFLAAANALKPFSWRLAGWAGLKQAVSTYSTATE